MNKFVINSVKRFLSLNLMLKLSLRIRISITSIKSEVKYMKFSNSSPSGLYPSTFAGLRFHKRLSFMAVVWRWEPPGFQIAFPCIIR